MSTFLKKRAGTHTQQARRVIAIFILATVIAAPFGVRPQQAHALDAVTVVGGEGTIQETISAAADVAIEAIEKSLLIKEWTLDGIAFGLAKKAMQQVTKSTLRWINSGFEGGPAFVTDLEGFLAQSADEVAGEIIYGSDLQALCSPFELDIRLALEVNLMDPTVEKQVQCTLSGVVDNVDDFLNGDFAAGGLPGWFELTVNPSNNFFGAYASADAAIRGEVADRKEAELAKLGYSDGFFAKQECATITWNDGETEEVCNDVLPGKTISEALSFEFSTGQRALIEADEINEIISALFTQITTQALQGAGGLLGLTRTGGSYGDTSYLDRIDNPQYDPLADGGGTNTGSDDFIAAAIGDENTYRGLYAGVVSRAEAINVQVSGDQCSQNSQIRAQVKPILDEALREQNAADQNLAQLRDLQARFTTATLEERQDIVTEFTTLQASGQLHSSITTARDKFEVDELKSRLDSIASQIPTNCGGSGNSGNEE